MNESKLFRYLHACEVNKLNKISLELIRISIFVIRDKSRENTSEYNREVILEISDLIHNLPSFINSSDIKDAHPYYSKDNYIREIYSVIVYLIKMHINKSSLIIDSLSFLSECNKEGIIAEIVH